MLHVNVTTDIASTLRGLDLQQKQTRFALAVALTRTAQDVKKAEVDEMRRVFDRPTPYTLKSLFLKSATRDKLEALVWVKDDRAGSGTPAERYLLPQIEGGRRSLKSFERALQRAGHMRVGDVAVPGQFARLDRYGNVSFGQLIQILSQFRITLTAGHDRNISTDRKKAAKSRERAGGQYIALPRGRGKLPPGVYQRRDFKRGSSAPRPVLIFVRGAQYKRRLRFAEVAKRVIDTRFPAQFERAYADALRTAR